MKNTTSSLIFIGIFLIFTNPYFPIHGEENNKNNTYPKISNWYFTMEPLDNWSYENVIDNSGIAQMLGFGPIIGINLIPKDELEKSLSNNTAFSFATVTKDNNFSFKNVPLDFYVKQKIQSLQAEILNQSDTTIDNENATKIYIDTKKLDGSKMLMYFMIHNDDPYYIGYHGVGKFFEKYLPEFEQMIRTIKWID